MNQEGQSAAIDTLLDQKTYTIFDGGKNLSEFCLDLLSGQKKTWFDLWEGFESLKDARERDLSCKGFSVRLQYNPRRIKSSMANVAGKDGKRQRCFLCLAHLPEGQKGILYRKEYLILCNPIPVFSPHFTVSHLDHRSQVIFENIGTFFQLMADWGSSWRVLYNGPKCGASAPDHLHFQVIPSEQMPIEKEIRENNRVTLIRKVDGVLIYRTRDLGRENIIMVGDDPMALESVFKGFLDGLKKALLVEEEPMMNIVGIYEGRKWRLVIFPRRKHRPEVFFKEGDARIVVSPGVIDMGGVLITPVEKDFECLDAALVESIFGEVSLDGKTVERAINKISPP